MRLRLLTGGCAALLSRFFSLFLRRLRRLLFLPSPRFSFLLWAAAPPLLFASPLALLSGGCAAPTPSASPPLLFRFFGGCAASLSSPRSRGRLAPPPRPPLTLSSLSNNYQTFNAVTCHELFFFCHNNIFLDYHCVTVLGYTALNFKAFGHKFLSFGKFFLLIRKKFVPL